MKNFFLSSVMFYMFMILFFFSLFFFYYDMSMFFEWLLMSHSSLNLEVVILIDWVSLLFSSFVMMISSLILLYSVIYMSNEKFINRFNYLLVLFIFSMILMIMSPNMISILFGWDGLGLVSYCLVIYYQNYMSYNSGMVTILMNRIGDVGILLAISMFMMVGSWNIMMLGKNKMIMLMLVIAALTKSAQIPFSVWLPMAMAAPTPISALVHSSTLVTAGVYLMIRFNEFLILSGINMILFMLSIFTMFMSGVMANVEIDLKKIIALSTLSQLGLMMMILSLGCKMLAFYHLLIHAIFKSMLFMCAGIIIHSMVDNQDIRLLGGLSKSIPFTMMSFFIASLALSGLPFLAGFYSKDLIMENIIMMKINMFCMMFILVSLMFTVSYSVRLMYYIFFSNMKYSSYLESKENILMNFSMLILILFSIFMGSIMNWMFFFDEYVSFLSIYLKFITLLFCIMGIFMGSMFIILNLLKLYYLSYFLSSMWFLMYLNLWFYVPFNLFSKNIIIQFDKNWVELLSKGLILYLIKGHTLSEATSYKLYMFIYFFIVSLFFIWSSY